jgi:hypothetical protein
MRFRKQQIHSKNSMNIPQKRPFDSNTSTNTFWFFVKLASFDTCCDIQLFVDVYGLKNANKQMGNRSN